MRKYVEYMPTLFLIASIAMAFFSHDAAVGAAIVTSACLWGFWFVESKPKKDDTPRLDALDQQLADLIDSRDEMAKTLDALKTAVGMRQLR